MKKIFIVKDWLANINLSKHSTNDLAQQEIYKLEEKDKLDSTFVSGTYVILEVEDSEDLLKQKEGGLF